jgi:hypothetical protein
VKCAQWHYDHYQSTEQTWTSDAAWSCKHALYRWSILIVIVIQTIAQRCNVWGVSIEILITSGSFVWVQLQVVEVNWFINYPQSDIEWEVKSPINLYHEVKRFHTSSEPDINRLFPKHNEVKWKQSTKSEGTITRLKNKSISQVDQALGYDYGGLWGPN